MEFIFAFPFLLLPLAFPLIAGLMARSFGKSFRFWFWISFLIPFISCLILLCLPEKEEKISAVENEELFDHLFEEADTTKTLIRS